MAEAITVILLFAPLAAVIWAANQSEREKQAGRSGRGAAAASIALLTVLYFLLALVGFALTVDAALGYPEPGPVLRAVSVEAENPIESEMLVGLGFLVPSLLGLMLLYVRIPDSLSRGLGMTIRRDNVVHAVAVSMTMLVFVNLVTTLGFGLGNLANASSANGGSTSLLGLWVQSLLMVVLALIGVGWPVRRALTDAMSRLGVHAISARQAGIGIALGVAMAPLILVVVMAAVAVGIEPDADVEALNEALLGPLMGTPLGVFTIGFAAGIGEEILLRGALQPRFGLWVTAGLFAVLHSNYGLSMSTLVVFVAGVALGLARIRYNTTTTILMHAAYNITLSLLSTFASSYFEP